MEYKRIRAKKIYEEVADSLIDMIKTGNLKPGDKLESVEKMAENFGVGRSAIREALSGLRSMGLVEMRQGEGTYVMGFDPTKFTLPVSTAFLMKTKDVKELYEVRKILEAGTAGVAAINYQEDDLHIIGNTLDKMADANGDEETASIADAEFHIAVAKATHNQLLINLMGSVSELISETIKETRKVLLYSEQRSEKLLKEHYRVFEAIKNRDKEKASAMMYEHLEGVNQVLLKYID